MARHETRLRYALIATLALPAGMPCAASGQATQDTRPIDEYSYRLGSLATFAEMVHRDVKKLALSSPMTPAEMDEFMPGARKAAADESVSLYRESSLLVADLFPAALTAGRDVLLIYKGATLDEYLALKRRQRELIDGKGHCGRAREEIAREFGRLLSYSEAQIDELLRAANPPPCPAER